MRPDALATALTLALLALPACGGPFDDIATTDRSAYFRCFSSIRASVCRAAGASSCSTAHQPAYAALPDSDRRRWLTSHGCPRAIAYADYPRPRYPDTLQRRPRRSARGFDDLVATSARRSSVLRITAHIDSGERHAHLTLGHGGAPSGEPPCPMLAATIDGQPVPLPRAWSYARRGLEAVDETVPIALLDRMASAHEVRLLACGDAVQLDELQLALLRDFVDQLRAALASLPPPPPDVTGRVTVTSVHGVPDVAVGSTCTLRVRADTTPGMCRASFVCGDVVVYARSDHPHRTPCTTLSHTPPAVAGGEDDPTTTDGDPAMRFDSTIGSVVASDGPSPEHEPFTLAGQLVMEAAASPSAGSLSAPNPL